MRLTITTAYLQTAAKGKKENKKINNNQHENELPICGQKQRNRQKRLTAFKMQESEQ